MHLKLRSTWFRFLLLTWFQIPLWFWFPELQKAKFRDILQAFFKQRRKKSWAKTCVGFLNISGKGGFGNTKFIAFEKLAWHYECFICACCNESMVGKGFIQDEGAIICPECARKKMLEEMEEENEEETRVQTRITNY